MEPQHLIFDADDTLWENNVFYEATIEGFIDLVDHAELSRTQVRAAVDEAERENIRRHGYGADIFMSSLMNCLRTLRQPHPVFPAEEAKVAELCSPVRNMQIVLIADVAATLDVLSGRHRLYLLTKGSESEQRKKIKDSGLAHYFEDTVVVPEKNVSAYRGFVAERDLPAQRTWMIGNSLRSDINPALACGLGAVFIPHPMTWSLEKDRTPESDPRFLTLERFGVLSEIF